MYHRALMDAGNIVVVVVGGEQCEQGYIIFFLLLKI